MNGTVPRKVLTKHIQITFQKFVLDAKIKHQLFN